MGKGKDSGFSSGGSVTNAAKYAKYAEGVRVRQNGTISSKQAGVIYGAVKRGEVKLGEGGVSYIYNTMANDSTYRSPMISAGITKVDTTSAKHLGSAINAIFDKNPAAANYFIKKFVDNEVSTRYFQYSDKADLKRQQEAFRSKFYN